MTDADAGAVSDNVGDIWRLTISASNGSWDILVDEKTGRGFLARLEDALSEGWKAEKAPGTLRIEGFCNTADRARRTLVVRPERLDGAELHRLSY